MKQFPVVDAHWCYLVHCYLSLLVQSPCLWKVCYWNLAVTESLMTWQHLSPFSVCALLVWWMISSSIVHVKGLAPIAGLCVSVSLRGRAVSPLPPAGVSQKFVASLFFSLVPAPACLCCLVLSRSLLSPPCRWLKLHFQLVFLKVCSENWSAISLFLQACSSAYWLLFRISQ